MTTCPQCDHTGPCEPCWYDLAHGPHSHNNPHGTPRPTTPPRRVRCDHCGSNSVHQWPDSRVRTACETCGRTANPVPCPCHRCRQVRDHFAPSGGVVTAGRGLSITPVTPRRIES